MKKRFKVIIGISAFCTAAGIFASLICCALSAFPELLEAEGQNKEVAHESLAIETNNFHNAEPENNEVASIGVGNGGAVAPSNYETHDVAIVAPTVNKESDKAIAETPSIVEEVKSHRGKEHFSGFYEYRYEEEAAVKEKNNAINIRKDEDDNKILECTLLVLVIVQAIGFVILQHKNKEPQIECLENRENHLD